jgi:hypothetical protein
VKPLFCFIDDTRFERENFRAHALEGFARVEFVIAESFAQAREMIGERLPLCFLLDIFGLDPQGGGDAADLRLPAPERLAAVLGEAASLEELYAGVEPTGEGANAFLRRVYAQVERWQRAFLLAAGGVGQSRAYGLYNLARVREHYPWAACLGYSRKALYLDAAALVQAGADGLLQKPQGVGDEAIARATRQESPELARQAYATVERRLAQEAASLVARLCRERDAGQAQTAALAEALADAVGHLNLNRTGEPPRRGRQEACQALDAFRREGGRRPPRDLAVAHILRQWLNSFGSLP